MIQIQPWVEDILADAVTKHPCKLDDLERVDGVPNCRVFLKNTHGFTEWADGQEAYEAWASKVDKTVEEYRAEIAYDRPVYQHFRLEGRILDCGGGAGTVREFLPDGAEFISTDPWTRAPFAISEVRKEAYTCLRKPLNFLAATAEFQPFVANAFDWVHMRSMLDHVQVPDLALLEARRVLRAGGHLLIGLTVEGGKSGVVSLKDHAKEWIKASLGLIGIDRWKDHHVWHPTYKNLVKLVQDSGLIVTDTYWQPHWHDKVCYVCARKPV